jgi:hypothetical protein
MTDIEGGPRAIEAAELAALARGREPAEIASRLAAVAARLAEGGAPEDSELVLLERMRARYGRELAELRRPEPW